MNKSVVASTVIGIRTDRIHQVRRMVLPGLLTILTSSCEGSDGETSTDFETDAREASISSEMEDGLGSEPQAVELSADPVVLDARVRRVCPGVEESEPLPLEIRWSLDAIQTGDEAIETWSPTIQVRNASESDLAVELNVALAADGMRHQRKQRRHLVSSDQTIEIPVDLRRFSVDFDSLRYAAALDVQAHVFDANGRRIYKQSLPSANAHVEQSTRRVRFYNRKAYRTRFNAGNYRSAEASPSENGSIHGGTGVGTYLRTTPLDEPVDNDQP